MTSWLRRHLVLITYAVTVAAVSLVAYFVLVEDVDVVDALLLIEVVLLIMVGLPLSIRGTAQLIGAVRESTRDDRLARAITGYLALVTLTGIYIVAVQIARMLVDGNSLPDWTRVITGALTLAVLCGPAYVVHVAQHPHHR